MERVKGIEPSYEAWEAAVLPLNYTRSRRGFYPSVRVPGGRRRLPPKSRRLVLSLCCCKAFARRFRSLLHQLLIECIGRGPKAAEVGDLLPVQVARGFAGALLQFLPQPQYATVAGTSSGAAGRRAAAISISSACANCSSAQSGLEGMSPAWASSPMPAANQR